MLAVSSLVEDEFGRVIKGLNCDSLGSEVFVHVVACFVTDGLLTLLEVVELGMCNYAD